MQAKLRICHSMKYYTVEHFLHLPFYNSCLDAEKHKLLLIYKMRYVYNFALNRISVRWIHSIDQPKTFTSLCGL